jgi:thymidylate synthase (FAD)
MSEWKKVNEAGTEWEPVYTEVLNHGFVGLVDFMGDDSAIVNAARVSYGKGTKVVQSDEGLIRYLMRHWHTTPFEMCDFKFHVKAPIFVFRQWHRHRTASINEYSGRYSILDNEMYVPDYNHTLPQSRDNKQGRSDNLLDPEDYNAVHTALEHVNETAYQTYLYLCGPNEAGVQPAAPDALQERRKIIEKAAMDAIMKLRQQQAFAPEEEQIVVDEDMAESVLRDWFMQSGAHVITDEFPGIARELARMVLPVATYSQMYWKANLHNIMHFLRLRADAHAQYEIRIYAEAMMDLITPIVPMAMKAFEDYQLHASHLSRMETEMVRAARNGLLDITQDGQVEDFLKQNGCSSREVAEFIKRF